MLMYVLNKQALLKSAVLCYLGLWRTTQIWDTHGLLQELWWIPHWLYGEVSKTK